MTERCNRHALQKFNTQNDSAKPRAMTAYIKASWQNTADQAQSATYGKAVTTFFSKMDKLCTDSLDYLNFVHLNAILHGTALIWTSAASAKEQRHVLTPELRQFLTRMLDKVQMLMPTIGAREASNILHSFSMLGINPDTLQPQTTDGLARQFLRNIENASDRSYTHAIQACA